MGLRQIFLQTVQDTNSDFTAAITIALRGLEGKKMHSEPQAATDDLKLALWFVAELLKKDWNQNKKDILMQLRTDVDLGTKKDEAFASSAYMSKLEEIPVGNRKRKLGSDRIPAVVRASTKAIPKPKATPKAVPCSSTSLAVVVCEPDASMEHQEEAAPPRPAYHFDGEYFTDNIHGAMSEKDLRAWATNFYKHKKTQINLKVVNVAGDKCRAVYVYCRACDPAPCADCDAKKVIRQRQCAKCQCPRADKFTLMRRETAQKMVAWAPYFPEIFPDWVLVHEILNEHRGGDSDSNVKKQQRLRKREWAHNETPPSMLYDKARADANIPNEYIPKPEAVTAERAHWKRQLQGESNQGESPAELDLLCDEWMGTEDMPAWEPFVMRKGCDTSESTLMPYTADYLCTSLQGYILEGLSYYKRDRFLKVVGDYTHGETKQQLKKLKIGVAGTHFIRGNWRNTILPFVYAAANQEGTDPIRRTMDAIEELLLEVYAVDLKKHIEAIYWDGEIGAINEFQARYIGIPVHYCLQHAKTNIKERCSGNWRKLVPNMIEMIAFQPPNVAHHSIELLLEKLLENKQKEVVRYLCFANSAAALVMSSGRMYAVKWN